MKKATLKFAKPEPRKRAKARARRVETALMKAVRAACVERDGYCRIGRERLRGRGLALVGQCSGPSEWAHLDDRRRFKTRGMAPEKRHATEWSMMLCKRHHDCYDAHGFDFVFESERWGADGAVGVRSDWRVDV